jgi:hypothetical protein
MDAAQSYLAELEEVRTTSQKERPNSRSKHRYDYAFEVIRGDEIVYSSREFETLRAAVDRVKDYQADTFLCFERRSVPIKSFSFTSEEAVKWVPEYVKLISPHELLERARSLFNSEAR